MSSSNNNNNNKLPSAVTHGHIFGTGPPSRSDLEYFKQQAGENFTDPMDGFRCMNLRSRLQLLLSLDGEEAYTSAIIQVKKDRKKDADSKQQQQQTKKLEEFIFQSEEKILKSTQADMNFAEVRTLC